MKTSCLRLSIIIPVYNVERYIDKCLKSIFSQDIELSLFEVIIVNDGTKDNSMSYVNKYAKEFPNIIIINQDNSGLSSARNTGLDNAKGEYIWFIDSDDFVTESSIESIFKLIENSPLLIATSLNIIYDDPSKNHVERKGVKTQYIEYSDYLQTMSTAAIPRYIIKKELIDKYNLRFISGIYHEDIEYGLRLVFYAKTILYSDKILYNYYQRQAGSITSSWKLKNTTDYILIFNYNQEFLRLSARGPKDKDLIKLYSIECLFNAFPFSQLRNNNEINRIYLKYISTIRKESLALLSSKYIKLKKRIKLILSAISPKLYLRIKNK